MTARVLVAGVGNIFFRDDGFGVEVARRLALRGLPAGAVVEDYGIRGVHLAFALLDPPELLVVVDALALGHAPGTVFVVEAPTAGEALTGAAPDAHAMDVCAVLASARAMGAALPRVLVVGCEPESLEEGIGLSAPVLAAVEPAVDLALTIVGLHLAPADGAADAEEARP